MDSSEVSSGQALAGQGPASPDFFRCSRAKLPPGAREIKCCPPKTNEAVIQDFKFPKFPDTRIRPPAHMADPEYIAKFNRALELMKKLDESDPRNFEQQAAVHCAYCVDSYPQDGVRPDQVFQVHYSWLFLPFHRWYLYFFERILGKLIHDPTFAIPFWNWDSPSGMEMPSFYTEPTSAFYDSYRDANHQPPTLVDLNFCPKDTSDQRNPDQINHNLNVMYKQMVSGATTPELFLGGTYRAGDRPDDNPIGNYSYHGAGSLENVPHNTVHNWCGDPNQTNQEDMGSFYSAGFDPIFFGHHANVDRLWSVWKTIPGGKRQDFTDPDWLNASFVFFDENKIPVRVYVKDCLDTEKLGYVYQDVPNPWLDAKPTPGKGAKTAVEGVPFADDVFPAKLDETVKAIVARPKKSRSKEEKEKEEEVLLIDGIEVEANVFVKFDVFINEEDEKTSGPHKTEWAGSFVNLRHTEKMKTSLKLGISELLGAEDEENVLVTLVPKAGAEHVSIGAVKIVSIGAVKIDYLSK